MATVKCRVGASGVWGVLAIGLLSVFGPSARGQHAAVTNDAASKPHTTLTEYRLDKDVVEIPFEYREHQILVKGSAYGKSDLTFMFDSGASSPVLDSRLGLNGSMPSDQTIEEASGESKALALQVDEIRMGEAGNSASAHHIRALITDLSQISRLLARHIDGIIGASFMAGFVVELDYEKHLLRLHRSQENLLQTRRPDNRSSFLLDLIPTNPINPASSMLAKGMLNPNYDYDFLVDTGSGGYAGITVRAAEQSGLLREDTPRVRETSYGVSHSFKSEKIRALYLMLGKLDLAGKVITVDYRSQNTINPSGILGNWFLQNYHVTLDFPRRKLFLERVRAKDEEDETVRPMIGAEFKSYGVLIRVDRVKSASPAKMAGVRAGDLLVSINGEPVSEKQAEQVLEVLNSADEEIRLEFQRGIDPNLGTPGKIYTRSIVPLSPLDWRFEPSR